MAYFFRAAVIILALSLLLLFIEVPGTIGFKVTVVSILVSLFASIISGIYLRKKRTEGENIK
ncbi:MAG: hypothetical protein LKJ88_05410 [Bacilli bacterium]|jgi:UPF0716 family protein affecting phage T7 exclusion|nr:hypothetical protein [Bacilli bacterium]